MEALGMGMGKHGMKGFGEDLSFPFNSSKHV